jgi:hypothetical protein
MAVAVVCIMFGSAASSKIMDLTGENFKSAVASHSILAVAVYGEGCETCSDFDKKWQKVPDYNRT